MILDLLTDEEKAVFAGICTLTVHKKGDMIVKEGEPGDTLLIIRSGRAQVRKHIGRDEYRTLKDLKPGEFFGEMSFLERAPRSACVVAAASTEVLGLKEKDFDKLIRQYPVIGTKVFGAIAREMASRLRKNNDQLKKIFSQVLEE